MRALLINPCIYDFAAYSFWSSPLGLLYVGSILRKNGIDISLVDCMRVVEGKRRADGRAPFIKEQTAKPTGLQHVRKRFKRYGISRDTLMAELSAMKEPELVLITSIMTYWYPGVKEAVGAARKAFPTSKIIVGGIYPSLCKDHALRILPGADLIVASSELERFYSFVEKTFNGALPYKPSMYDLDTIPYPCYDLYGTIPFVPILTSFGCMFRCTYCATPYMHPVIVRRKPETAVEEIKHWKALGVGRYVLYDDNFLYQSNLYARPLLEQIANLPFPVDIYNPNALNGAMIDDSLAVLLRAAGFKEVRIGLESANPLVQRSTGGKVNLKGFTIAVEALVKSGFQRGELVAYILAGLPYQKWQEVKQSIDYVLDLGIQPYIAEYTPIPHTQLFEEFEEYARFPIREDPIYQNNALFPFAWHGFTEKDLESLKLYVRSKKLSEPCNG